MSGPAPSIAVVGAGKMGSALLAGLWRGEKLGRVLVIEPNPAPDVVELCRAKNFALFARVESSDAPVDALVLAIKPQMLEAAAPALSPLVGPDTLVLSILAGKRVADLASRLPARAFVRAMPNTPAAVGRGVTGVGSVEWVETEELIDAVTAISGSGPAYLFYLAECLAAAGVAAGLPDELAARLARATVEGAGELMHRTPDASPGRLRENVTSPSRGRPAAGVPLTAVPASPVPVRATSGSRCPTRRLAC